MSKSVSEASPNTFGRLAVGVLAKVKWVFQ